VRDRRTPPRGVLPRHIQTWLMLGVAGVILLIIVMTGHPQPAVHPEPADKTRTTAPVLPERVRGFERQLTDDEARLRELAGRVTGGQSPAAVPPSTGASPRLADDRPPNAEASLAADNVAFSRRSNTSTAQPGSRTPEPPLDSAARAVASELTALDPWLRALGAGMPNSPGPIGAAATPTTVQKPASPPMPTPPSTDVDDVQRGSSTNRLRVLEGTVIEAVLLNRLDGTYAGPVAALVTSPVYSHDRQSLVIPAGAKVLGSAAAVQSWGESRLAVRFHRLVMPDGHTYSLDLFRGLSQVGETGLRDRANRHYGQVFGASLAIGALSGLAQLQTHSGLNMTFADTAGQGAGSSLASSAARVLDRYLNVLPTVTIREGYRLKVYLTNDLELPSYGRTFGGVR
jgi:type IV secretion system protein VirB10